MPTPLPDARRRLLSLAGIALALGLARVLLTSGLPTVLRHLDVDDGLFLRLAGELSHGRWLGAYDRTTLVKGVGYPLFLAGCELAGVGRRLAEDALLGFAGVVLAVNLRRLGTGRFVALAVTAIAIFHPATFGTHVYRLTRDGIYVTQVLLILAVAAGVAAPRKLHWTRFAEASALGVTLAWFWCTREEAWWIVPALLPIVITTWKAIATGGTSRFRATLVTLWLVGVVAAIPCATLATIAAENSRRLRFDGDVEFRDENFIAAVSAILRATPVPAQRFEPLTRAAREYLYARSPAFAELRPTIEDPAPNSPFAGETDDERRKWCQAWLDAQTWTDPLTGRAFGPPPERSAADAADLVAASHDGSMMSWYFVWLLRDAAAQAGHHPDAASARAFYGRLAQEVNDALDQAPFAVHARRATLTPRLTPPLTRHVIGRAADLLADLATVAVTSASTGPDERGFDADDQAADILPRAVGSAVATGAPTALGATFRRLDLVHAAFRVLAGPLLLLAALGIVASCRRRGRPLPGSWGVLVGLLVAAATRVGIVAIIEGACWPTRGAYVLCAHPLWFAAMTLAASSGVCAIRAGFAAAPAGAFRRRVPLLVLLGLPLGALAVFAGSVPGIIARTPEPRAPLTVAYRVDTGSGRWFIDRPLHRTAGAAPHVLALDLGGEPDWFAAAAPAQDGIEIELEARGSDQIPLTVHWEGPDAAAHGADLIGLPSGGVVTIRVTPGTPIARIGLSSVASGRAVTLGALRPIVGTLSTPVPPQVSGSRPTLRARIPTGADTSREILLDGVPSTDYLIGITPLRLAVPACLPGVAGMAGVRIEPASPAPRKGPAEHEIVAIRTDEKGHAAVPLKPGLATASEGATRLVWFAQAFGANGFTNLLALTR